LSKSKQYNKLTADLKKCADLLKDVDLEVQGLDLSKVEVKFQHEKCTEQLKSNDMGIIDTVKLLFDTIKGFKTCMEKQPPASTKDPILEGAKKVAGLITSVILNFVFPGATLIIGGIKIGIHLD
jgi:hypothetical protein